MRTAERSGYLANRLLICSMYGSSTLACRAAWDDGGCSSFRAAATVWREQCSRRAIAQPESFSISLRRRISAHKATFMARSSFGQELPRQPLVGTRLRAASALGQVRGDGRPQAPAATALELTATDRRSGPDPAVPAEPSPESAVIAAVGWSACGRCRTTTRGGRPRPRGKSTAASLRATDGHHVHAETGEPPRTSPSRADA